LWNPKEVYKDIIAFTANKLVFEQILFPWTI
jgi:hypothetical protein